MKKVLKSLIAAAISAIFVFSLAACSGTASLENLPATVDVGSWIVTSPDGNIRADMKLDSAGSLTYTVKRGTELVVEPSNLGLDIAEDDFRVVSVDKVTERRVQGVYRNKSGKSASVEYDCNELTLTLKGYEFYLDVIIREYKSVEEAHDAFGYDCITEKEYCDILEIFEKGEEYIEKHLSPQEVAVKILGEFMGRLSSEIRSFEFDLLPPEEQLRLLREQEERREETERAKMHRKK